MVNKKLFISTLIFSTLMLVTILFTFSTDTNTNKKITAYIEKIGWQIDNKPSNISHYKIPSDFDTVFQTYNEIQKKSGFNLETYKGKNITAYTYTVKNHKLSNNISVYVTILVYKNQIIGGEIFSTEQPVFISSLTDTNNLTTE